MEKRKKEKAEQEQILANKRAEEQQKLDDDRAKVRNRPFFSPPHPVFCFFLVCVKIRLCITAQSCSVILVILYFSNWCSQGEINDIYYENL